MALPIFRQELTRLMRLAAAGVPRFFLKDTQWEIDGHAPFP
jgi:hypothetical protein